MAILTITYDLRKPGQDYKDLYEAIKNLGSWAHPVQSVWLVDTASSASVVLETLRKHIDSNDKLLVLSPNVPRWSSLRLDDKVVEWMKTHF